jgi:hypothetical protein
MDSDATLPHAFSTRGKAAYLDLAQRLSGILANSALAFTILNFLPPSA